MKCTVALAQVDSRVGDIAANVATHVRLAQKAKKAGADIVVFPELSLTGYGLKDVASEIALDPAKDPALEAIREVSRSIACVVGLVESGSDHGVYNSAVHFEKGKVRHIHRKVYLPTYGMFEEGRYFSSGAAVQAYDSQFGRFGVLVCEDMWHPSLPYLLALDGAEAIFCLTASPTRLGPKSEDLTNRVVNHEHNRSYARLLSLYTIFINRVGFEDGVNFWGGSAAFTPVGETVGECPLFEEHCSFVSLDSKEVRKARRTSRHVLDERPEVLRASLSRILNDKASTRIR